MKCGLLIEEEKLKSHFIYIANINLVKIMEFIVCLNFFF